MNIKIKIILLFALFISPLILLGQNPNNKQDKKFSIGVNAGALWSKVDFYPSHSFQSVNNQNLLYGLSFKYMTEKNFGLLMELNVAERGWKEEYEEDPTWNYKRKLRSLEIPFLSHASYGDKFRVFANAGPNISFFINEESEMSPDLTEYVDALKRLDPKNPFGTQYGDLDVKIDYGISGGAGFQLLTGMGNFTIEGRYYFGLGDIFNNKKVDYFSRSAYRVFSVHINYSVLIF